MVSVIRRNESSAETDTDPKQIPYDRLALQTTLYFAAPEENEVLPYLQAVSSSKDRQLPEDLLRSIYQTQLYRIPAQHPPSGIGFHPPASLVFQGPVSADLRRSLTTLQFWDGPPKPTSTTATSNDKSISSDLKRHLNLTECASFSDAFVGRKAATYRLVRFRPLIQAELSRNLRISMAMLHHQNLSENWNMLTLTFKLPM